MRAAILRSGTLLTLAALGTSTAPAQTELFFATGVNSTGWALAQSNADGHVLIESPQYPRGLWLRLVDEAGDALAGIRVEYQGRPASLVAIHCVDPAGEVQETLAWTRPDGDLLRLTLKSNELADLLGGVAPIDWRIDPTSESLLDVAETQLIGWEAVAAFLRNHWQDQAGRVVVQIDTHTALAIDLGYPESIERLVDYLQDQVRPPLGAINDSTLQILLNAQVFKSDLVLLEGVIILITDVSPLAALTNLKELDLFRSQVADVSPLADLNKLEWLRLVSNQITDVNSLATLTKLERLNLEDNQITDVNSLATLTNLRVLYLKDNQIKDISSLVANTGLGGDDWVNLENNPLSTQARNEHIPALKARGVGVTY